MKMDLPNFVLFFLVLLLHLSAEQIGIDNAPRIITDNGNIIFETALTKSIRFDTHGGEIRLNNIDLSVLSNEINSIKSSMEQIKELKKCNCELINQKLADNFREIGNLKDQMKTSSDKTTALSAVIDDIKQKIATDDCAHSPCHNGGTCVDGYNTYKCICTENFKGQNCMDDVNECVQLAGTDQGCQNNGRCENYVGGFRCVCLGKWTGVLCNLPLNGCAGSSNSDLCGHGICMADHSINNPRSFKCICDNGWALDPVTKTCITDIDECQVGRFPCSPNPHVDCINTPGHFTCASCPPGFNGNGYQCSDINECATANICNTNEECINSFGSYACPCITGMRRGLLGLCQRENVCEINNGGCNINAACMMNIYRVEGRVCTCNAGYVGNGVGINGCLAERIGNTTNHAYRRCVRRQSCQNGGRCELTQDGFRCQCPPEFRGSRCRIEIINPCIQNPCLNQGRCEYLESNHYRCHCKPLYSGLNCESEHSECGGTFVSPMEEQQITLMTSQSMARTFHFPCSWTIVVTSEQYIQITPILLNLMGPCSEEYVKLEEKSSINDRRSLLGKYCQNSNSALQSFNTSGPILYITAVLRTGISELHGFNFTIIPRNIASDNFDCCRCLNSQIIMTNVTSGLFQSAHFPLKYPQQFNCIMRFEREFGERYRMELHIKTVDMGDRVGNCTESDYLKISFVEKGEIKITACNQQIFYNRKFETSGFKIQHYSDNKIDTNSSRFQLVWKKTTNQDVCGGKISINPKGTIVGPALSSEVEAYCTWKLDHKNTSRLIYFKGIFENWVDGDCSVYMRIINVNNGEHSIVWQTCQTEHMLQETLDQTDGDVIIIFGKAKGVSTPAFQIDVEYKCGQSVDMDRLTEYKFQSDNYPGDYDSNVECIYLFKSQTRKLSITFTDLDINDEYPCSSDYLKISGSQNGYFDRRFCNGNSEELIPIDKSSSHDLISVVFHSNESVSGRGFKAIVKVFECGGSMFLNKRGIIAYPETYLNLSTYNLDHRYENNKNCTWDVYSSPGTYMIAVFTEFHLESHNNCLYDYLLISYDNKTTRFCGNAAGDIYTRGNRLKIQFVSDFSVKGEGFSLRLYSDNQKRFCHQEIEASEGIIFSPEIGSLSRPYVCIYSISVPRGRKISFNITIEGADFSNSRTISRRQCFGEARINIINGNHGSGTITTVCQQDPQRGEILTSYNKAIVYYMVPRYRSTSEFNFTIRFLSFDEECGSNHDGLRDEIASPNYPLFAHPNTHCRWRISSKPGHRIYIVIIHLRSGSISETDQCDNKHPVIKLQSETSEVNIMCNEHDKPYFFDDRIVYVIFDNGYNDKYRFKLFYDKVCTYSMNTIHGRIESSNLLFEYPYQCEWTLTTLRGSTIDLQFDKFDLPPSVEGICSSYVKISDRKGEVMGNTCGNELINTTFTMLTPPIKVKHKIKISTPIEILTGHKGIILEYQAKGCIHNLKYDPHEIYRYYGEQIKRSDTITNPNYPGSNSNVDCLWNFETIVGYSIKLTFDIIELDYHINCTDGPILKAWESSNTNDDSVMEICQAKNDNANPMIFQSSTHKLYLKYLSAIDPNGGQRRFHGKYEFVHSSCEYEINLSSGVIQSPNYPNPYPNNARCSWKITAREGMSIHLQFLTFYLEDGNCRYDYVEIVSLINNEKYVLGKECGKIENMTRMHYESISNQLIINFHTDHGSAQKGFKAKFFEGCGGLRMATGKKDLLLSPHFPFAYSLPDRMCEWTIFANDTQPGSRIFFYLLSFETRSNNRSNNCSLGLDSPDNSLTIIDGTAESMAIKAIICANQVYHPIVSTGNILKVVLRSSMGNAIFKAAYGSGDTVCGGDYYLDDGLLNSPMYPDAVNMEIDCIYIVKNSPGSEISLVFEDFSRHLENAYQFYDSLDIRNGPSETSPLIARFHTLIEVHNTTKTLRFNNSVWLRLRSSGDEHTNIIKFSARFHINYINAFQSDQGLLGSPQLGHVYSEDTQMTWTINGETSQSLEITFEQFSVGRKLDSGDCSRGRLTITDSDGLVKIYCGPNLPEVETFSTPITIELLAEGYRYPGFLLRWSIPKNETHTKIGNCSYIIKASRNPQILTSPNFPGLYPVNSDCQWIIETDNNYYLQIQMLNFSLERDPLCKYDNFTVTFQGRRDIYDYSRDFQKTLCGTQNLSIFNFFNEYFFQKVQLNFKVDESVHFTGFKLSYQIKCGYDIIGLQEGWLQSDGYPNALTEYKNCTYNLKIKRRNIILNFTGLNLPPKTNGKCVDGYLEIAMYRYSEKYCGTNIPPSLTPFLTNSSRVIIKLIGDFQKYSPFSGFRLKYSLEEVEECGGVHQLSQPYDFLYITNPNNVSYYSPTYIDCQWYITSTYGTRMQIDFERMIFYHNSFDRGCKDNYLALYDGSTKLAPKIGGKNYCDSENSVFTTSNSLFIRFKISDGHVSFKLKITISACGGLLLHRRGNFHSPNYPSNYPRTVNCSWIIQVRNTIKIDFLDLQLENDCLKSNLSFFSIEDSEKNLYWNNCNRTELSFQVPTDRLTIVFTTNTTTPKKGFKLKYETTRFECGGTFTDPARQLNSTNYPSSIPPYQMCRWYIKADVSKRIVIKVLNFNIRGRGCLTINRPTYYYRDLIRFCNQNLENYEIDTNVSSVEVYIYSYRVARISFSYHTDFPSFCGGHIHPNLNETGTISIENPRVNFCEHIIHNYPESEGTIAFGIYEHNGIHCDYDTITLNSEITGPPNNIWDVMMKCNSSENKNFFATLGKTVNFRFSIREGINLTNVKVNVIYKYNKCGGLLTSMIGIIKSPGYPEKYSDIANCEWLLQAPDNMHIKLLIHTLHLEAHPNCQYDSLIIRNGPSFDSPPSQTLCGQHNIANETIHYRTNLLRLSFRSDHSVNEDGFFIEYTFINAVDNCNGFIYETSGFIASPNYPRPHPSNLNCNWTISLPVGYRINVTFALPFDIEPSHHAVCEYDSLKIYDSNRNIMLANLCGNVPPSKPIISSRNLMGFVFSTDYNHNLDGFKAIYSPICGGIYNETLGEFGSPSQYILDGYSSDCTFLIPSWENHLTIIEIKPDLKYCWYTNNKLKVYKEGFSGMYNLNQEICESSDNPITILNHKSIKMEYRIERWAIESSFKVKYWHEENVKVYQNFTRKIRISTPMFPNPYHHFANMLWKIEAPDGFIFAIKAISIDIEPGHNGCNYDFVAFYNGSDTNSSNLIHKFCGNINIYPFRFNSNILTIHFFSDSSHAANHSGFKATIQPTPGPSLGCGGIVQVPEGKIGYLWSLDRDNDGSYDIDLSCKWYLTASYGYAVQITFENNSVQMENRIRRSCIYDSLTIYDGSSLSSPVIQTLCGNDQIDPIISSSDNVIILFETDMSVGGKGFNLSYTAVRSRGNVRIVATNLTQPLESNSYPLDTPFDSNLYAEIDTEQEYDHIIIEVKDLKLRPSVNCSIDRFIIQDTSLMTVNKIRKICKSLDMPYVFISSHNKVLLQYQIGPAENEIGEYSKRFSLTYKIYNCNRTEESYSGRLFNIEKYKKQNYNSNQYCNVTLKAPMENLRFQFYFRNFQLEMSHTCRFDYIQFIFGRSNEPQTILPKICGEYIPASFISNSSQVTMIFFADASAQRHGYDITYVVNKDPQMKCGGDIELDSGAVTSPGYGNNYYEEGHCIWNIMLLSDTLLRWKITDLGLGNNTFSEGACNSNIDFVKITNGNQMWKFCGNVYNNQPVTANSKLITVEYRSLVGGTGLGFRLEWDIPDSY